MSPYCKRQPFMPLKDGAEDPDKSVTFLAVRTCAVCLRARPGECRLAHSGGAALQLVATGALEVAGGSVVVSVTVALHVAVVGGRQRTAAPHCRWGRRHSRRLTFAEVSSNGRFKTPHWSISGAWSHKEVLFQGCILFKFFTNYLEHWGSFHPVRPLHGHGVFVFSKHGEDPTKHQP